jgi:protein TonB
VEVISGSPMLARAAVDAVRQWKYEPFRLNGAAIQAEASIRLDFNPEVHPKQ